MNMLCGLLGLYCGLSNGVVQNLFFGPPKNNWEAIVHIDGALIDFNKSPVGIECPQGYELKVEKKEVAEGRWQVFVHCGPTETSALEQEGTE